MTRVQVSSAADPDRRLFLLQAAGLLGLTGCLGGPPEDGPQETPSPITQFRGIGTVAGDGDPAVSFGGYINGQSPQQDGLFTYRGHQYAAFWNERGQQVLVRRPTGNGPWEYAVIAPEYVAQPGNAKHATSLGVSPLDGRLHVAFGHLASDLRYVSSVAGLMTSPDSVPWRTESFGPVTSNLGTQLVDQVTYARFVTAPNGKMLLSYRFGSIVGGGDEVLWEYDGATATWTRIGTYIAGSATRNDPFLHSLEFDGERLHAAWCWRATPESLTSNQDLLYAFSDDLGRTWFNNDLQRVGTAEAAPITPDSDVRVWAIGPDRGLLHQEHMIVDHAGRVHVLLSHLPDALPDDPDFFRARTMSEFFHYWRDTDKVWRRQALKVGAQGISRGKLAVASSGNLYAVLPNIRIATASAHAAWANWRLMDVVLSGRYFSDPLIDRQQLRQSDQLTIFTPSVLLDGKVNVDTINFALY
jgi:hypothetical protein